MGETLNKGFDIGFSKDRQARTLVLSKKMYEKMCTYAMSHTKGAKRPSSPEELREVINNTKHPWERFAEAGVGSFQVDHILIQPVFDPELIKDIDIPIMEYKEFGPGTEESFIKASKAWKEDFGPGIMAQATPKGEGREIGKLVISDIEDRIKKGVETYGEPLKANNGRDPLIDAYQEALDLAIYLRQAIEEKQ